MCIDWMICPDAACNPNRYTENFGIELVYIRGNVSPRPQGCFSWRRARRSPIA